MALGLHLFFFHLFRAFSCAIIADQQEINSEIILMMDLIWL